MNSVKNNNFIWLSGNLKADAGNHLSNGASLNGMSPGSLISCIRNSAILIFIIIIFSAPGGNMKEIDFEEFRTFISSEGIDECEVSFDGDEIEAPVTGNKYLFLQIVTYCGETDIKSSYRTWNSDGPFSLVYKNFKVVLSPAKVRTFIRETANYQAVDPDDGRLLHSAEFGLIRNEKYFVRISSEEYHLPPERGGVNPRKRTNHVLWISSRPFTNGIPQVELTPMYRGWSY